MTPEERLGVRIPEPGKPYSLLGKVVTFSISISFMMLLMWPYMLACVVLLPFRPLRVRLGNVVGQLTGRFVYWVLGISHRVVGEDIEAQAPALYVCNHVGSIDFFMSIQLCPAPGSGTVKRSMIYFPIMGQMYWMSGHLMLPRTNHTKAIDAMAKVAKMVKDNGMSIWILPEGTRSKTGRLLPFKKGFAHLALDTGLPIVPVVVHGAHKLWNKNSDIRPGEFVVEVLPKVSTEDWTRETLDTHVDEIRQLFLDRLGPDQLPA